MITPRMPYTVTDLDSATRPGQRFLTVAEFYTLPEAEAWLAGHPNPEDVARGRYAIDGPNEDDRTEHGEPLTGQAAEDVFAELVRNAGADPLDREQFVAAQTSRFVSEYRFLGGLGFGGKFHRTCTPRSGGGFDESWTVSAYREDTVRNPVVAADIETTNTGLAHIRAAHLAD